MRKIFYSAATRLFIFGLIAYLFLNLILLPLKDSGVLILAIFIMTGPMPWTDAIFYIFNAVLVMNILFSFIWYILEKTGIAKPFTFSFWKTELIIIIAMTLQAAVFILFDIYFDNFLRKNIFHFAENLSAHDYFIGFVCFFFLNLFLSFIKYLVSSFAEFLKPAKFSNDS